MDPQILPGWEMHQHHSPYLKSEQLAELLVAMQNSQKGVEKVDRLTEEISKAKRAAHITPHSA